MAETAKIQIFRAVDAPELSETTAMTVKPMTPEQRAGLTKVVEAGYGEGGETKLLVNQPGFSLTHAWFKKDYPLLLHSHDSDCLYYIVSGTLQMGTEALAAGDSFFVPGGAAYTYRPGPDGVEVLEFRHATSFDFVNLAKNPAFYDKAAATVAENHEDWLTAKRPPLNA
jgi:mannose-6-phosphate isomerase-like protein (cupin superfamily)